MTQMMTRGTIKLANAINKAMAGKELTFDEIWDAFSLNLSYLLAEMPVDDRCCGYNDLLDRVERIISENRADGVKGAILPNLHRH